MDMRAPGAAAGVYALECAMDELSYALGIDPLELRLKNYSELEQNQDKPFSSKALKDCYYRGAGKFGWAKRDPRPRSMREGRELIGYGMASGIWEALRVPTSAEVELTPEGRLLVRTAAADIGTGTYTILAQIGAEMLGLPLDQVEIRIGDSDLPACPVEGGSWTAASAGSAVMQACDSVRQQLLKTRAKDQNVTTEGRRTRRHRIRRRRDRATVRRFAHGAFGRIAPPTQRADQGQSHLDSGSEGREAFRA